MIHIIIRRVVSRAAVLIQRAYRKWRQRHAGASSGMSTTAPPPSPSDGTQSTPGGQSLQLDTDTNVNNGCDDSVATDAVVTDRSAHLTAL